MAAKPSSPCPLPLAALQTELSVTIKPDTFIQPSPANRPAVLSYLVTLFRPCGANLAARCDQVPRTVLAANVANPVVFGGLVPGTTYAATVAPVGANGQGGDAISKSKVVPASTRRRRLAL